MEWNQIFNLLAFLIWAAVGPIIIYSGPTTLAYTLIWIVLMINLGANLVR